MADDSTDAPSDLTRATVDALPGAVLLEFGASWCGHCRRAAPLIADALQSHPQVRHQWIEDGPGRRLGRSFQVTLWPTLIFLRDGREVQRLVRPTQREDIEEALAQLA